MNSLFKKEGLSEFIRNIHKKYYFVMGVGGEVADYLHPGRQSELTNQDIKSMPENVYDDILKHL